MTEIDKAWWDEAWQTYLDKNPNLNLKQLESPQEFAKFLEENRIIVAQHRLVTMFWVGAILQAIWNILMSIVVIYTLWLVKFG